MISQAHYYFSIHSELAHIFTCVTNQHAFMKQTIVVIYLGDTGKL